MHLAGVGRWSRPNTFNLVGDYMASGPDARNRIQWLRFSGLISWRRSVIGNQTYNTYDSIFLLQAYLALAP